MFLRIFSIASLQIFINLKNLYPDRRIGGNPMLRRSSILFIIMLLFPLAMLCQSQDLVKSAWDAWSQNDRLSTEKYFTQALTDESSAFRARLGLTYLYQLMENPQTAWLHYQKAIELAEDPEPYLYAGMIASRMYAIRNQKKSGIMNLYQRLSETGRHSTLRASASEMVGRYLEEHAEPEKAAKYYSRLQAITDWMVIGPFDNISASGFDRTFPPELEMNPKAEYSGKNDIPVFWFPIQRCRHDRWIDFRRYFPNNEAVFYANTFIQSPIQQTVQFRVGTSGAVKLFLNDEKIIEWMDENNNDLDTYIAETTLQAGWNRVLIKCSFSEINQCNFMLRITGPEGEKLDQLIVDSGTKSYPSRPGAPVKIIPHFAEAFFLDKISQNPGHLENYLLLAEVYLRNDKAIEAELILKQALEKAPENALILHQLIEAFTRGEKYDEIVTTIEKLEQLDPMIPTVLDYQFDEAIDNQDFEKAAAVMEDLERVLPDSPEKMQYRISLYHAKNEPEKVIATSEEAVKRYPDNWGYVQANAYLSLYITKTPDAAIKSLKKYAKNHTQDDVLTTLMEFYLKAGDFKNWEKTAKKRTEYNPAAPGFLYDMALTYKTMQNFEMAEKYLQQTVEICPQSALYWSELGDTRRITQQNMAAIQAYEKALDYNPTFYDSRDKLRELQQKMPIFNHFEGVSIDSLIRNAPAHEAYPDDGAVILLSDAKRIVYARGASESMEEILVRVLKPTGIDQFKEYWISYNPYTEKLIVEKAVVIKPDRSEINADQDDNHIVFKTLEEGDFIYVKWKIRNYYSGKLSNHFWDHFYFNAFYPVIDIRYALLVPDEFNFQYQTQLMDATPQVIETDDGLLYQWRLKNEPAIQYEYKMPVLDDIGKILYITSIPDWAFIVDWYTDLAKTKTRPSYEIKETVKKLLGEKPLSEQEIIRRIHHFITENIRYSYVPFRQSGLIPQKARDVLVNRIGDCKDMATLAIAMLKEAGIQAHYVIVNTRDEGLNRHGLPSIDFNHAIIHINADEPLYIDLTAQNYAVGSVPQEDMEAFALNIQPGVNAPIYLDKNWFLKRKISRQSTGSFNRENDLVMKISSKRTGSFAAQTRQAYRFQSQKDREKTLLESLNRDYPNVELNTFELFDIDSITPEIRYAYEFSVPGYLNEAGRYKILKIPWTDALIPNRALSYDKRDYPYNYWPAADYEEEAITLTLPEGFRPLEMPSQIQFTSSVADYTLNLAYKKGAIEAKRIFINKKWVVSPDAYIEFKTFYNNAIKADGTQILLEKTE
jgi:tetratricopeptide (TPR) repeat protein